MVVVLVFIIGLCIGSFLNVLADRIPANKGFLTGRSMCDFCHKPLKWYDMVPLLSFVFLKGKCRFCKKKLSYFYPIVELTTGILFVATYLYIFKFPISNIQYQISNSVFEIGSIGNYLKLVFIFYIMSSLIVIFFADLKYKIIPNLIVYPAVVITGIFLFLTHNSYIVNHVFSAFGALLFFLLLFIATKGKGMGFGDVQFSFLMGFLLGFPSIVIALYLAFLTGALVSIILIVVRKFSLKDSVPFGPFLVAGTIIALFFGNTIVSFFPYL